MFEQKGYFKEYWLNGKFIGTKECEKDREEMGYFGRRKEIVKETLTFKTKIIKAGTEVETQLHILCGKINAST